MHTHNGDFKAGIRTPREIFIRIYFANFRRFLRQNFCFNFLSGCRCFTYHDIYNPMADKQLISVTIGAMPEFQNKGTPVLLETLSAPLREFGGELSVPTLGFGAEDHAIKF